jgi:hypothetical protein
VTAPRAASAVKPRARAIRTLVARSFEPKQPQSRLRTPRARATECDGGERSLRNADEKGGRDGDLREHEPEVRRRAQDVGHAVGLEPAGIPRGELRPSRPEKDCGGRETRD